MRIRNAALMAGVFLIAACGGDDETSPRDSCIAAEQTMNTAAKDCDPQFAGHIDLSCNNFGTGSGCGAIDAYFDCLVATSCNNGTLVIRTDCKLAACD